MPGIKNFSTEVAPEVSIGEIQAQLRKVAIRRCSVEYDDDGEPSGVAFTAETDWGLRSYVVPVDIDGVHRVMSKTQSGKLATRQQAVRVAWRLAKDWVAVQVAYIEAGAAVFEQIMLPYMRTSPDSDTTVYDLALAQHAQSALPAGQSGRKK